MTNASNTAAKPAAVRRFGTLKRVQRKTTRGGKAYAIITLDCKKFEQVAYVFGDKLVAQVLAAGEGAVVWLRGIFERAQRKNAEGRSYEEDVMKVVAFGEQNAPVAQADAAEEEVVSDETQDLTAIKGIGAAVAEQLTAAGITNYAQLADATTETLDAVKAGLGKRAASGDWQAQAKAMAETAAPAVIEEDEEVPF